MVDCIVVEDLRLDVQTEKVGLISGDSFFCTCDDNVDCDSSDPSAFFFAFEVLSSLLCILSVLACSIEVAFDSLSSCFCSFGLFDCFGSGRCWS